MRGHAVSARPEVLNLVGAVGALGSADVEDREGAAMGDLKTRLA
jgi:hypothetical protein